MSPNWKIFTCSQQTGILKNKIVTIPYHELLSNKRSGTLMFVTTGINLQRLTLKKRQPQKLDAM